jgi:ubiquinone/menaquinone biosynthesis C-methylase UbiE
MFNFIKWVLFEQPTSARLLVERALKREVANLRTGTVLEIGAGQANSHIEHLNEDFQYYSLDICAAARPVIVGDALALPLHDQSMDSIMMFEVMEHVPTPDLLLRECFRVLKEGGTMIGSTRFMYPQHGSPSDYYRFTEAALKTLLEDFSELRILKLGNKWHVVVDILFEKWSWLRFGNRLLQYVAVEPSTCYSGLFFTGKK